MQTTLHDRPGASASAGAALIWAVGMLVAVAGPRDGWMVSTAVKHGQRGNDAQHRVAAPATLTLVQLREGAPKASCRWFSQCDLAQSATAISLMTAMAGYGGAAPFPGERHVLGLLASADDPVRA